VVFTEKNDILLCDGPACNDAWHLSCHSRASAAAATGSSDLHRVDFKNDSAAAIGNMPMVGESWFCLKAACQKMQQRDKKDARSRRKEARRHFMSHGGGGAAGGHGGGATADRSMSIQYKWKQSPDAARWVQEFHNKRQAWDHKKRTLPTIELARSTYNLSADFARSDQEVEYRIMDEAGCCVRVLDLCAGLSPGIEVFKQLGIPVARTCTTLIWTSSFRVALLQALV
jgi:hypothetical protein